MTLKRHADCKAATICRDENGVFDNAPCPLLVANYRITALEADNARLRADLLAMGDKLKICSEELGKKAERKDATPCDPN